MKKGETPFFVILLCVAILFLAGALRITPLSELKVTSEGFYPLMIASVSVLLALCALLSVLKKKNERAGGEEKSALQKDVLVMCGLIALYAVLLFFVHYTVATLIFSTVAILYLGNGDKKAALLTGFISTMMIVLLFKYLFHVILP